MTSILNFFRSSVRHSVHIRAVAGTVRTRGIVTPTLLAEKEGTESLEEIASMIDEAADEATVHVVQPEIFKPFYAYSFTKPSDFSREARIEETQFHRSKRPYLGPGRPEAEYRDVFRQLDIDPLHEATNTKLLATYVTDMGKIKPRPVTKLTWRSQRKIGKAVRRARMMGMIPQLSKKTLAQTWTSGGGGEGRSPRGSSNDSSPSF